MRGVFAFYALAHLALFTAALARFNNYRTLSTLPLLLVTAGLVYDNAMIALGESIGLGEQLAQLSVPRFFMHAVSTPLLILAGLGLVRRTGANWSRTMQAGATAALLVLALVAAGFWSDMIMLQMQAQTEDGYISYGNANSVPIAPIATIAALLAAALVVWRRGGGPWFLAGVIAQIVATFAADALAFAGNLGELALMAGLVWTDWRLPPEISRQRTASA